MFDLKNKVAVITGASGGLGEAMAKAFSLHGAKIAILDLKDGEPIIKKLKTKGKYYHLDVLEEMNIERVINQIKKDFGKIDILVNNSGIFFPTPIEETSSKDWEKIIDVNLRGYFLVTKYSVPLMKKGGRIINIASIAGTHAFAGSSAYNASKGAVIMLTKTFATEFAQKGITANAICPGVFETPMTKDLLNSKEMQQMIKNSVPLARPAKAEEIGGLAVYLASEESSYMTGSIITLDGGWTCHL
ncbi:MAG: SDR family oxidoreductase [Nanoarchaeota archaeon]|nr:SDR family oxidoreductase [Nanoarchaeota archaeon]